MFEITRLVLIFPFVVHDKFLVINSCILSLDIKRLLSETRSSENKIIYAW